jgi:LuxR family maltose regulon positive regulatory protein
MLPTEIALHKEDIAPDLIQTKMNRPPLPVDLVPRPRLTAWLEQRHQRPLTLVSAPAGYGKSTLISCWLETVDCPAAWVSLDERDNQLGSFLGYFLAAVQTIFPDSVEETQSFLMAASQPPISAIAHSLINELNQIEEHFILVLDDYHLIENQTIHDLLNEILAHPPRNLHLVLGTRMDPLLPLVTLRANSQLTEIRVQDLRFTQEETQQLFQKMIGIPVDTTEISEMDTQAEGWVTGLRLAALAMRHRIGRDAIQGKLTLQNRYVTEYLVSEILAKQSVTLSDCMLKTSILERFCVDLCETLCFQETNPSDNGDAKSDFNGTRFLGWLQASNLFVIPIDDQHKWFRFHHLFRDFLQRELDSRFSPDEITSLHISAGRWYAQNDLIEEALYHLLPAGETETAIHLIAQKRQQMMNTTQWPRLDRWLKLFLPEVVENSAELWMIKIWLVYQRGQYAEIPALLKHLNAILGSESEAGTANQLVGEISALRCAIAYDNGDAEGAISFARQALGLVNPKLWIVRVMVRMYLGGSLLLQGDAQSGYQAYYGAFEEEQAQNQRFKATLLMTACYFHWVTADLQSMVQAAKQSIALCQESGHRQILGQSNYHLGCVRYQQNNLTDAAENFAWVVSRPYRNYGVPHTNSVCGLAMIYQAQGKEEQARDIIEGGIAFLLESGNTTQLPLLLALQAEIALRQRHLSAASQWAAKLEPVPPLTPMPYFLAPHLILVKVWLAQNTPVSYDKATQLLGQLQDYLEGIHNTRFLIDTFALQALLADTSGNPTAAQIALEKSLRLAQPGGFVRVFVDFGPQMATLLSRMKLDQTLDKYIEQILAAFPEEQIQNQRSAIHNLVEPLTNRELQILELLHKRMTNKEIAAELTISVGTVKGHTVHIYEKLGIKGRRQAVEKAIELGLLPTQ